MIPMVYIAGSFRAPTPWQVEQNIRRAEETGLAAVRLGAYPVIPHANTRFFHGQASDFFFLEATLELMRRCDALLLVQWDEGQRDSVGTRGEMAEAERLGIPVFHRLEQLKSWLREMEARPSTR